MWRCSCNFDGWEGEEEDNFKYIKLNIVKKTQILSLGQWFGNLKLSERLRVEILYPSFKKIINYFNRKGKSKK